MQYATSGRARKAQAGFTLIELSIVLVIIGLIVGAILTGQEMIKAAEIRAVISQIEKYNTAVNTFRAKYRGLPGDLSNSTTFFSYTGAANGDGNLVLTDTANTVANDETDFSNYAGELDQFWPDLSQGANLIEGSFIVAGSATPLGSGGNVPLSKLGRGGIIVMALNGLNRYHIGAASADWSASTVWTFANTAFTPMEAWQIDSKMDDGVANTGSVLARTGTASTAIDQAPASTGDGNCLSAAATYNVSASNADQDTTLCQLQIRMN